MFSSAEHLNNAERKQKENHIEKNRASGKKERKKKPPARQAPVPAETLSLYT